MRCSGVVAYLGNHLTYYRRRRLPAALAFVAASMVVGGVHADETVAAKIVVSASPAASYFGERVIEGAMDFHGRKYLLTLQGISGNASSVASVYGLRRARDIVGPYTPTTDGLRNPSGVTLRFDPPVTISGAALHIEIASRIYPKVSTGQGNDLE